MFTLCIISSSILGTCIYQTEWFLSEIDSNLCLKGIYGKEINVIKTRNSYVPFHYNKSDNTKKSYFSCCLFRNMSLYEAITRHMLLRKPLQPESTNSKTSWKICEPVNEKTNNLGSNHVQHKPGCTGRLEAGNFRGWKLWIEKLEEFYYQCSEKKGADQLCSYCEADLCLCFRLCRLLVFPCDGSCKNIFNTTTIRMSVGQRG